MSETNEWAETPRWVGDQIVSVRTEHLTVPDGQCALDHHPLTVDVTEVQDPGPVTMCACGRMLERVLVR